MQITAEQVETIQRALKATSEFPREIRDIPVPPDGRGIALLVDGALRLKAIIAINAAVDATLVLLDLMGQEIATTHPDIVAAVNRSIERLKKNPG